MWRQVAAHFTTTLSSSLLYVHEWSSWYISFIPTKRFPTWFPSMFSIDWKEGELFFTGGDTNGS